MATSRALLKYKREWARKFRKRTGNPRGRPRGQVIILTCFVRPRWMPVPVVSREQAEKEFLELTRDMG